MLILRKRILINLIGNKKNIERSFKTNLKCTISLTFTIFLDLNITNDTSTAMLNETL